MESASFIPSHPGEITAQWLTAVLGSKFGGARVADASVEEVGAGYGFVSTLARLHLTWDPPAPERPATLFAKLPSQEWLRIADRGSGVAGAVYLLESAFYLTLAPNAGVRVPACHHTAVTQSGSPFVLLLEDVAGEPLDQLVPPPRPRVEAVVDALARMHAKWWNAVGPDKVFWLPGTDHDAYREVARRVEESFDEWLERSEDTVFDYWRREEPGLADRVTEAARRLRTKAPAYFDAMAARRPQTLVHGDVRLDNLIFVDQGEPCFLDWQLVRRYPGPYDLAYFLSGSLPVEDRRRWEDDLVARYHEGLLRAGVEDYPLERCWDDYRVSMLLTAFGALVAVEWPDSTERGAELVRVVLTRHWTFILDHDLASLAPD